MKNLCYGSVCSGVESATLAWEALGWQPAWFAETAPFPSAVLHHHWPHVPNLGDMTRLAGLISRGDVAAPDILVGGTPCQAFSIAGLRGSLGDARGNLTLELVRILNAIDLVQLRAGVQPCTLVWENVPGVLNTHDNAFGCFLAGLAGEELPLEPAGRKWTDAGCVFGPQRRIAWRVLDAQYFGLPQRRRRVFLVASARDLDPAEILFERHREAGDSAPGRDSRQKVAAFTESCFGGYRRSGGVAAAPCAQSGHALGGSGSETLIVPGGIRRGSHWDYPDNPTLNQSSCGGIIGQSDQELFSQRGSGLVCMAHGQGGAEIRQDGAPTLTCNHEAPIVVHGRQDPCVSHQAYGLDTEGSGNTNVILNGMQIRRLLPLECERLQGMPDDHTRIPWRGKPADRCPDAPRYKAIGNAMAVPVMRWIGRRIQQCLKPLSPVS